MSPDNLSALRLSLQVAVAATALNALVGIPIAYALARRHFWGKSLVDLLVTLPLVLPPTVVGYYLIVLLGRRGFLGAPLYGLTGFTVAFTWYAAVIAATVMALPLLVRRCGRPSSRWIAIWARGLHPRPLRVAHRARGHAAARAQRHPGRARARVRPRPRRVRRHADARRQHPGPDPDLPLAIYTAVQTGESGEALGLVAALTALSCLVLIVANRLGARAA